MNEAVWSSCWSYNPIPRRVEKFNAHCKSSLRLCYTIRDAGDRSKRTSKRRNRQPVIDLPAPAAQNSRAPRAYVFCESRFRSRQRTVPAEVYAYFHGDSRLTAECIEVFRDSNPKRHIPPPVRPCTSAEYAFLQASCNVTETKLLFPAAFHAVKGAVCRSQELFDCGAVVRINRQSNAH